MRRLLHRQAFDRDLDQRYQIGVLFILPSRDPTQALIISCGLSLYRLRRPSIDVEFEDSGDHHDRPLLISVPVAHITECRIAADEKAPAVPTWLLNDPVSVAVLADH